MSQYEYSVIPSPRKGQSAKGIKGSEAKFANALSVLMNDMGSSGWEYVRADTLPCEERQGLTGKTVKYHSMLIFRRPLDEVVAETAAAETALAAPVAARTPGSEGTVETEVTTVPVAADEQRSEPPLTANGSTAEPFSSTQKSTDDKSVAAE